MFTDLKHWWLKFVQLIILPLIIVLSWGKWQTKKILFPKKNCIIYRFFLLAGWNGFPPEQFPMQKSCVHRISYFKRNHTFLLFHRSSNAEKSLFLPKSSPPSPNSAVVVHRSLARQLSTLLSCYQTLFFLKARFKKNSFQPSTTFSSEKKQSPRTEQCKSTIESASITMHCSAQHTAVTTHGKSLKEKSAKKNYL